ncbi:hypothetical protein TNCV_232441 [Trichonephila clavipes]|nr:hypothetical protein TNCV_232441 [Trichonephila clavipes]
MDTVDFLHHENPPTLTGVEPATIGAEGSKNPTPPPSRKVININTANQISSTAEKPSERRDEKIDVFKDISIHDETRPKTIN